MREVIERLKRINIRLTHQAKLNGFEVKEKKKPMKHDENLNDAVQRKINGRINLRNRGQSKP